MFEMSSSYKKHVLNYTLSISQTSGFMYDLPNFGHLLVVVLLYNTFYNIFMLILILPTILPRRTNNIHEITGFMS